MLEAPPTSQPLAEGRVSHYDDESVNVGKILAMLAVEANQIADAIRMRGDPPDPREIALQVLHDHPDVPPQFYSVLVRLVREHLDEIETPVG